MKLRSLILPDPIIPEDLDYNHIWQRIVVLDLNAPRM